jgi:hypothetical protein
MPRQHPGFSYAANRSLEPFESGFHHRPSARFTDAAGSRSVEVTSSFCQRKRMSPRNWKVQGGAKLSHLIFQNLRRAVRKAVEGGHKSVSRKP